MRVRQYHVFKGPSLFSLRPVIRLTLDPEGWDIRKADGQSGAVAQRLESLLPGDVSLWDAGEQPGGAVSLAECIARFALVLQRQFGYALTERQILEAGPQDDVEIVYAYAEADLGLNAGRIAVDLTRQAAEMSPASEESGQLSDLLDRANEQLRQVTTQILTRHTLWEADRRGIPWSRINYSDGFMQLGQGHKRRRFRNSYWQGTSYLAARLAMSKIASAELLRSNGIPVPQHRLVYDVEAAVAAAADIGYPVVVKPNGRDMGTAVSINLTNAEAVRRAFAVARRHGAVLVEEYVGGVDCRITVLHGRMIAASNNKVARVVGDGESTVQALIDEINSNPRRGLRDFSQLQKIKVDSVVLDTLEKQGCSLESVLPQGKSVALRAWWRQGKDHSSEDLTGRIHPANQAVMERAARLVGLDLAGVDYITTDISRPWYEVGGVINEINPTPGFVSHIRAGAPDVHRIVVEEFFPPGDDGRIPLGVLLAAPKAAAAVHLVGRLLMALDHCPVTATAEGVCLSEQRLTRVPGTGADGAEMAFAEPLSTAAVLEVSDVTAARQGLGFDRALVVGVMAEPQSLDAARLVLRCAGDFVVLNADLPEVAGLAGDVEGRRILWVSCSPAEGQVQQHIATGGAAVVLSGSAEGAEVLLWDAGECHVTSRLDDFRAETDVSDAIVVLFAVAILYGMTRSVPDTVRGEAGGSVHPRPW